MNIQNQSETIAKKDQHASERSIREKINRWWTKIKHQAKTKQIHFMSRKKAKEPKKMLITDL